MENEMEPGLLQVSITGECQDGPQCTLFSLFVQKQDEWTLAKGKRLA